MAGDAPSTAGVEGGGVGHVEHDRLAVDLLGQPRRRRRRVRRRSRRCAAPSAARRRAKAAPRPGAGAGDEGDLPSSGWLAHGGRPLNGASLRLVATAFVRPTDRVLDGPERDHPGAPVLPPGLPVAAVRTGQPRGRGLAARRPRGHRLGRRLRRPPLRPGRPSSARCSTRRPTGCCSSSASAASSSTAAPRSWFSIARRSRARWSSAATLAVLTLFGHEAHRRHVVGQGRHVRADVRVPVLPAGLAGDVPVSTTSSGCAAGCSASPACCSATTPPSPTSR